MIMEEIEVTVQSILPSDEPQGRFRLRVSPDATVEALLRDLCREANTPLRTEYCLRSKGHDLLSRSETLQGAGILDGAFLHWTSEDVETKTPFRCSLFWFLAILSFIIGAAGITAICVIRFKDTQAVIDYAIVFDAGSTHTSMFIYKWEGSKFNGTALAAQAGEKCDVIGGAISSYVNHPNDAGKSLETCLQKAKDMIPQHKHSTTPVYLGATAGMRLLKESNPNETKAILESVRNTFKGSGFKFVAPNEAVRIISGFDEGSFSWITSNYITNSFDVQRPGLNGGIPARTIVPSVGALDLGGASTQITFMPLKGTTMPEGFGRVLQLYGTNYTVYTHSYLCYGVQQVTNRILAALFQEHVNETQIEHPCLPSGFNTTKTYKEITASPCVSGSAGKQSFGSSILPSGDVDLDQNITFVGESNTSQCTDLVKSSLFNFTGCPYSSCSFNGVYQPEVAGSFFAFSSYYYISAFLNLTTNSSVFDHKKLDSAINSLCGMTWKEVQEIPAKGKVKENLPWYCMQSVYMNTLLYDGYKFTDASWKGIQFVNKIFSTEVGWTLGFVLNESGDYPSEYPEATMETLTFSLLMVLFILFIMVSVGLAVQGRRMKGMLSHRRYKRMDSYGAI
ncbi:ectonucleoside triphosphate diphosphohydrolase 2 [Aplysia californica]|uniref:Ectonucleoside triphosphate diphosphohydrolase 2 n=1 Tax=Aplysia californica TaxID=6500 RepID=A0ABM0JN12_APLCA|nr:ectonucleoside triphosphate diphosphohydrolase 2 [Aplysia californica]